MDATTELESMPPLRNAPSGTSAIMRMRTDSSNFSRTRALTASVRSGGGSAAGAGNASSGPAVPRRGFVGEPTSGGNAADGAIGGQRIRNVIELEVEPQRIGVGIREALQLGAGRRFHCRNRSRWGARRSTAASCRSGRAPAEDGSGGRPRWRRRTCPAAAEPLHAFLLVQVNQSFGVAGGAELVPARHQIGAQFLVAVDLAVEDDPHRAILIGDGLVAGGKIDDTQPAHAEAAPAIHMHAFIVRTAMANLVAHGLYQRRLGRLIETHKTGDSAHREPETRSTPSNLASPAERAVIQGPPRGG